MQFIYKNKNIKEGAQNWDDKIEPLNPEEQNEVQEGAQDWDDKIEPLNPEEQNEVQEAVTTDRLYDSDDVKDAIRSNLSDEDNERADLDQLIPSGEELSAEQVDHYIALVAERLNLSEDIIITIEDDIIASSDPKAKRIEDFSEDISADIDSIKALAEEVRSVAARERLLNLANTLAAIDYDGDKDTGWKKEHDLFGGSNPTKNIIA
jgi:hypothetical protein